MILALSHVPECARSPRAPGAAASCRQVFFFLSFLGVWVTSLPCPALGVVPATDPTLILDPAGARSLVMAHILQENGKVPSRPQFQSGMSQTALWNVPLALEGKLG